MTTDTMRILSTAIAVLALDIMPGVQMQHSLAHALLPEEKAQELLRSQSEPNEGEPQMCSLVVTAIRLWSLQY